MLKFFNTLSGQVEEFRPMREGEVRMYLCGPTVWDFAQIGNFRSMIMGDIVRRTFKFKGYKVTHVMNITDIEDRIIALSQSAGVTIDEYTARYIEAFWEDWDALGLERPDIVPRATQHVTEMVSLIARHARVSVFHFSRLFKHFTTRVLFLVLVRIDALARARDIASKVDLRELAVFRK